jgi:hypothetical protein
MFTEMATDTVRRGPIEKEISESAGDGLNRGDLHQDVEVGPEMIDIDRIEKVYRYYLSQFFPSIAKRSLCS